MPRTAEDSPVGAKGTSERLGEELIRELSPGVLERLYGEQDMTLAEIGTVLLVVNKLLARGAHLDDIHALVRAGTAIMGGIPMAESTATNAVHIALQHQSSTLDQEQMKAIGRRHAHAGKAKWTDAEIERILAALREERFHFIREGELFFRPTEIARWLNGEVSPNRDPKVRIPDVKSLIGRRLRAKTETIKAELLAAAKPD